MGDCCHHGSELEVLRDRQSGTLKIVLAINAGMFFLMMATALYAGSSALLADSLDNLGDALTYGLSLWAVRLGLRMKTRVALFKGAMILFAALAVLGQIGYKLLHPAVPLLEAMGMLSVLALAANGLCLGLLWRHRADDINMSSVWECSRNDIVANTAVLVAAAGVWATESPWPDVAVASFLVVFLLRSATRVLSAAHAQLRAASAGTVT
jgi:Co/Zn/Cd efflux system component